MRECKNICKRFVTISFGFGEKIYKKQIKFCKTCDIFLEQTKLGVNAASQISDTSHDIGDKICQV